MTTTIHSNGSKWAGEAPDSIEKLLDVLGSNVLNRLFENGKGHPFISVCKAREKWALPGVIRFHGNFLNLSHVFSIDTDESALAGKLTEAIYANMERPDYQSQPTFEQRQAADEEYRRERDAKRQAERERQAKAVLGL